ncbi:hypothetical protein BDW72DRAFT_72950 [Aspergillus terricola var. indicus]
MTASSPEPHTYQAPGNGDDASRFPGLMSLGQSGHPSTTQGIPEEQSQISKDVNSSGSEAPTWHNYLDTDISLCSYRPGSFDTSFIYPSNPYQPGQITSNMNLSLNAGGNDKDATFSITSYQPVSSDTSYICPNPLSQPAQNVGDANIGYNPHRDNTDVIIPVTSYHPGCFSASHVYPNTPYQPIQYSGGTTNGQNGQENHVDATIPVTPYYPGSFNVKEVCPITPYQPVHRSSDVTGVLGLPLELSNSTLACSMSSSDLVFSKSSSIPCQACPPPPELSA